MSACARHRAYVHAKDNTKRCAQALCAVSQENIFVEQHEYICNDIGYKMGIDRYKINPRKWEILLCEDGKRRREFSHLRVHFAQKVATNAPNMKSIELNSNAFPSYYSYGLNRSIDGNEWKYWHETLDFAAYNSDRLLANILTWTDVCLQKSISRHSPSREFRHTGLASNGHLFLKIFTITRAIH